MLICHGVVDKWTDFGINGEAEILFGYLAKKKVNWLIYLFVWRGYIHSDNLSPNWVKRRCFKLFKLFFFVLTFFVLVECKTVNKGTMKVRAGESLYLPCPNTDSYNSSCDWWRTLISTKQDEQIGTEESKHVHYHQSGLYILRLTLNDTGRYIGRWWSHTHTHFTHLSIHLL